MTNPKAHTMTAEKLIAELLEALELILDRSERGWLVTMFRRTRLITLTLRRAGQSGMLGCFKNGRVPQPLTNPSTPALRRETAQASIRPLSPSQARLYGV